MLPVPPGLWLQAPCLRSAVQVCTALWVVKSLDRWLTVMVGTIQVLPTLQSPSATKSTFASSSASGPGSTGDTGSGGNSYPASTSATSTSATSTNAGSSCSVARSFPTSGAAASACGANSDCRIDFELGSFVEWSPYPDSPALVTELHFVNSAARATCITTSCNTDVFNSYYRQSETDCSVPPCATNTIDCDCNIVVGPIRLPNGRLTSV